MEVCYPFGRKNGRNAVNRRSFSTLIGGAAVWPAGAHTQQSAAPVIGFISTGSPTAFAPLVAVFQRGFSENGYIDGQNVRIEYHWAEGRYDQSAVTFSSTASSGRNVAI